MKSTTPAMSELFFGRMEVTAKAYDGLQDRIKAENRVRTPHENRLITLWKIEQEAYRRKWADARKDEGHDIKLFNRLEAPTCSSTLKIRTIGDRPTIYLYGEIGAKYGGVTSADFQRELAAIPDDAPIALHVNSEGGVYSNGLAIRSLLASRAGAVVGFVDGLAASAATIVLTGCDRIVMSRGSIFMIHFSQGNVSGPVENLETAVELMRAANEEILQCYLPRWTGTKEELRAALEKETWFSAEAAVEAGLADMVSDTVALAAHVGSHHKYRNVPGSLTIAAHGAYRPIADRVELYMHRAICV